MTQLTPSTSHLILVPSYNTGAILHKTITEILLNWSPVWVIIDGSDDGSEQLLKPLQQDSPEQLKVIILPTNQGKGAAVLSGVIQAQQQGFSHVLIMDADLQHPAAAIHDFMQQSHAQPTAVILGQPIFDASAPALRVHGRKISNAFAHLETLGKSIQDSLFGMRVYPIADLIAVMQQTHWARRFDFEPEVAVRLAWRGVPMLNLPTPVRYIPPSEGGISQFRYIRDNTLLTWMHLRLLLHFLFRLPVVLFRK